MNRKILALTVLVLLICPLWAGDTAVFVDLGFSTDGRNYMFGQYGIKADTLRPWAELGVVDVPSNNFVPGGRISYVHDKEVSAGHDGSGALFRVIGRNTALADRYNIGYLLQGKALYVSLDGDAGSGSETIEFRDFERADTFRAVLNANGYGSTAGSFFSINLERRNSDGSVKTYTVGNSAIKRPGIVSYRINRVLAAPRGDALIFVIEMRKLNPDGSIDIRYMVETLKL
jgi:predicted secreted protein